MNKLEKVVVKAVRTLTEKSVEEYACTWVFHQPKISESMRKRLKATR